MFSLEIWRPSAFFVVAYCNVSEWNWTESAQCQIIRYILQFFFAVRLSDQLTSKVCQSKQFQIISVFVCSQQWFFCGGLVAVHTILSKWLYWRSRISLLKFYTIFLCFHDFHLANVDHGMVAGEKWLKIMFILSFVQTSIMKISINVRFSMS